MTPVGLVVALLVGAWAPQGEGPPARWVDEVRFELDARDLARDLDSALAAVEASGAARWNERCARLDALARALEFDPGTPRLALPAALLAAASDAHPNVRAAALVAAGLEPRWAASLLARRELCQALARDLLPETRAALAAAHVAAFEGGLDPAPAIDLLIDLAADEDVEVRRTAGHALVAALASGELERSPQRLADLVTQLWSAGEHHPTLDLIVALEAAVPPVAGLERFAAGLEGELLAVARALVLVAGGEADPLEIATHWPPRFGDRARLEPLLWRAVHASGEATPWLEVAIERGDGDLARAVTYALGTGPLVELAPVLPGVDALPLLEALGESVTRWEAADAEALLASEAPVGAVVDALGAAALEGDPGASACLAAALVGLPPGPRERALRLLSPAAIAEHSDAIFAAWEATGRPLDWIDRLPRGVPAAAFRLALLEFGADRGLRARVAAPLGAFDGDPVVIELLTGWLDEELSDVELGVQASGQGAEALASALLHAGGATSAAVVAGAVASAAGPAPDVAAALARRLGESASGRAHLAAMLGRDAAVPGPWPTAVIDEALIAIAAAGATASGDLELLVERLPAMPDERQARAFTSLRLRGAEVSAAAVAALAADSTARLTLRLRAIDALTAIGPRAVDLVVDVFRLERDFEVRAACVRVLGDIGGEQGIRGLERLRQELGGDRQQPGFVEPAVEEGRVLLDEELRIELAGLAAPVLDGEGGFLCAVVDDAPRGVVARFARESGPSVEFLWRVEIAAALALARAGRLGEGLAASDAWWHADGRLLLLLARAAEGEDGARLDLARAAVVALLGESGPVGTSTDRARLVAFALEVDGGQWEAIAGRAGQLLRGRVLGQLSDRAWQAALGGPLPADGRDPLVWLQCLRHQARAMAALDRGEMDAARAAADRAAPLAPRSSAAAELQARIEDRLKG
ncbi:hypothetical protein [Engelhardtia mirabilis]|uniref:HEAT repeat protein n=1 Tax=Engelhardtia mirabilis TaxID=2528011 RepID=A0A518BQK5_9BACT|nr:hypothetical protein Pla133_43590 [Planctomycetes bacterium Pla133]QDV03569.1 hypothetical protein Pla86_43580 [Planctomycetes bacterium Pla86]